MAKKKAEQDLISKFADRGEEAIHQALDVVGGLRDRVDDVYKRVRSLDPLEKRVRELERRLDEIAPKKKKPAARAKAVARKVTAKKG